MSQQSRPPFFRAWWKAKEGLVGRDLYAQAERIELNTAYWKSRCATLYKLTNGEDAPITFSYWLTKRVATYLGTQETIYKRPYVNIVSEGISVLENRIGTTQNIVEVSPNDTSFAVREACQDATSALDSIFESHGVFETQRLTFRDRGTFGMSYIKVVPTPEEDGIDIHRVLPSFILVDNTTIGAPREMIEVCFIQRDELWALYGDRDAATDMAIRNAPLAFMQSPNGTVSEMCVLLEGWHLPGPGKDKGRHVLCLPNCDLVDEEWKKDHFPFVVGRWKPQTVGWLANGGAFDAVPYQLKINDLVRRIDEAQLAAHGYWITDGTAGLQAKNLGARPRAVIQKQAGSEVEYVTPQAAQPELYADLDRWVNMGLEHGFGITRSTAAGEKPSGVNSGRGLRIAVQIQDSRHKSLSIEGERETRLIAELIVETAAEIDLKVVTSGINARWLKWSELKLGKNNATVTVFPISSLPSEPAGRANEIDDRYANGVIDARTYRRLLAWGDLRSADNYATSGEDLIEATLDQICKTGEFIAPEQVEDARACLATASARYKLEKRFKSSRKVLRALQKYMAVAADYIANPDGQTMAPPAQPGQPAPGAPPPPGQIAPAMPMGPPARNGIGEPAAPPIQVASPMGAPPQLSG